MSRQFVEPPKGLKTLLAELRSFGLTVPDEDAALHDLRFIGNQRLIRYSTPFRRRKQRDTEFLPGTSFDRIVQLYNFDRELRQLVLGAVERIEVAFRACFVNEISSLHQSGHWFMKSECFVSRKQSQTTENGNGEKAFHIEGTLQRIKDELAVDPRRKKPKYRTRKATQAIQDYYRKFDEPELPPFWIVAEILGFGTLSLMYKNLAHASDRKLVASHFDVDEVVLSNWVQVITNVRNICAHHKRLWDQPLTTKVRIAKKHQGVIRSGDRFYAVAVIIFELLKTIFPTTIWNRELFALTKKYPHPIVYYRSDMGFPDCWEKEEFWNSPIPLNPGDEEMRWGQPTNLDRVPSTSGSVQPIGV